MALRADVLSSYALTLSRIAAWAGVSAIVFRRDGAEAFAVLALLRGTITLIGYTSLGLGPAMVRMMAETGANAATSRLPAETTPGAETPSASEIPIAQPAHAAPFLATAANPTISPPVLSYSTPREHVPTPQQEVYGAGLRLALFLFLAGGVLTLVYAAALPHLHQIPYYLQMPAMQVALCLGLGMAIRIITEPLSAALQVRGKLFVDNSILATAELCWLGGSLALLPSIGGIQSRDHAPLLSGVAICWLFVSIGILVARRIGRALVAPDLPNLDTAASAGLMRRLLVFGVTLVVAQLADFLYAPTDYILINRLLSPEDLAAYAPTVQIDAALLLIVSGLAAALFPHAALAHAAGDVQRVRRMYLRGTLASAACLVAAGAGAVLLAPWLFQLWLESDLPAARAILPWVLISTIVGGSSAVGRSILLGMGRVRPFTASVLIAGAANVGLSVLFASGFGFGLKGIVWGTTVVVVVRCGIWMPWYVTRAMRMANDVTLEEMPQVSS